MTSDIVGSKKYGTESCTANVSWVMDTCLQGVASDGMQEMGTKTTTGHADDILRRMEKRFERLVRGFSEELETPASRERFGKHLAKFGDVNTGGYRYFFVRVPSTPKRPLSPREHEIALLVTQAHSNKEIAKILQIKVPTVATHLRRVYDKCGVDSRTALAVFMVLGYTD